MGQNKAAPRVFLKVSAALISRLLKKESQKVPDEER
jgi:hypothetical protein